MKLSCLIVDDETLAQNVLKKYIGQVPSLVLQHSSDNALDALTYLHQHKIDLMFLDINMPELNGIEMLKTISSPPKVILTTAYSEYALESYEFNVCDYLLKPIRFERFLKAVNKLLVTPNGSIEHLPPPPLASANSMLIKDGNIVERVFLDHILYLEAYGNYLKVILQDETTLITRSTMNEMDNKLPASDFLRIHKSFIIRKEAISKIMTNQIMINGKTLPIGNSYRSEVFKKLNI